MFSQPAQEDGRKRFAELLRGELAIPYHSCSVKLDAYRLRCGAGVNQLQIYGSVARFTGHGIEQLRHSTFKPGVQAREVKCADGNGA
jgi:hypothetical protein